jgi:hypothetical protein
MTAPAPLPRSARVLTVLCVIAWIGAFTATHVPLNRVLRDMEFRPSDVWLHMVGYFGLTTIFLLTMFARRWRRYRRLVTILHVIPIYGVIDELTQPLVGRTAAVTDWLANIAGMILAIALIEGLAAWRSRRTATPAA